MKTPLRFAALASLPFLPCYSVAAESASTNAQTVELSPFVVAADNDTGYQAASTLSGTRFRTSLQDTAASVSVFTEAFIEDLQIQNVEELASFTVSQVIDLDDTILGWDQRTQSEATLTVQPIRIRGIQSSQAVDYFKRIYPSDGYNIGRYDESRGPNGILFGVSNAGGLINTSSVFADVRKNSGRARLTFESAGGSRQEFRYNRVLVPNRLGVVVAGVNQEDEGWQHHVWDDAERLYGALTWKVNDRLSFRVNAETGRRNHSTEQTSPPLAFGAMVYTDWVEFLGGNSALLFPAANANATAAQRTRGLGNRNTNANGANKRWAFVINDGAFYDAAGEYTYQEYGSAGVNGPNWTAPSDLTDTQRLRLNRPDLFPYTINATGPGQYKDEDFRSHSLFADLRVTDELYLNFGYNRQTIDVDAPNTAGFNWQITVDPNTTRGVPTLANGAPNPGYGGANPFAGYYMLESNWRRDTNHSETEEARLSAAYTLDFAKRGRGFLGSHQIGAMVATSTFDYERVNQALGFLGVPWAANFNAIDNRIQMRTYFPLEQAARDPASIHLPDWRTLPSTVTYNGATYGVGWFNQPAGGQNAAYKQKYDTYLGVVQSSFWNRRIVTTLGYRRDEVDMDQYGHSNDPLIGAVIDRGLIDSSNTFSGETRTAGLVFHVNKHLDLVANRSSNIGVPDARITVLPDGEVPDPSRGRGQDFGLGFHLFGNRLHGRVVYYTTDERALAVGGGNFNNYNSIITGLGSALIAAGRYTETTWNQRLAELGLDREWSGITYNLESEGYELHLVANLTPNWRLVLNASKTDRVQTDRNSDIAAFYGWTPDPDSPAEFGLYATGIVQDANGVYRITNPSVYAQGGGYANLILLGNELGDGGLETLSVVANGRTATDFMFAIQDGINRNRLQNQRRMGLRPYKFNLFTAYDFKRGFLEGLSIGGGFAWQDKAVIGLLPDLSEVYNDTLLKTNLMVRYRLRRETGWLKGDWSFQVNIDNVLDDDDAILQRYQNIGDFVKIYDLPGGWGPAAQRWDLVEGINGRASITYEF